MVRNSSCLGDFAFSEGNSSVLCGCSPWGCWESDTTEWLHFSLSCIGEGNGNPLQCSCLEDPRNGGAWWAAVYGVAQSRAWLKWLSSSMLLMKAKEWSSPWCYVSLCWVAQSCLTLCDPINCSLPGFSVHGILQARILEWVATSFSRGSSQPWDGTRTSCFSCISRWILCHWAIWEAPRVL